MKIYVDIDETICFYKDKREYPLAKPNLDNIKKSVLEELLSKISLNFSKFFVTCKMTSFLISSVFLDNIYIYIV